MVVGESMSSVWLDPRILQSGRVVHVVPGRSRVYFAEPRQSRGRPRRGDVRADPRILGRIHTAVRDREISLAAAAYLISPDVLIFPLVDRLVNEGFTDEDVLPEIEEIAGQHPETLRKALREV